MRKRRPEPAPVEASVAAPATGGGGGARADGGGAGAGAARLRRPHPRRRLRLRASSRAPRAGSTRATCARTAASRSPASAVRSDDVFGNGTLIELIGTPGSDGATLKILFADGEKDRTSGHVRVGRSPAAPPAELEARRARRRCSTAAEMPAGAEAAATAAGEPAPVGRAAARRRPPRPRPAARPWTRGVPAVRRCRPPSISTSTTRGSCRCCASASRPRTTSPTASAEIKTCATTASSPSRCSSTSSATRSPPRGRPPVRVEVLQAEHHRSTRCRPTPVEGAAIASHPAPRRLAEGIATSRTSSTPSLRSA